MSDLGDEDVHVLARVGVRRAAATTTQEPETLPPSSKIISLTRITIPAFEVVYRDIEGAWTDGHALFNKRAFELERLIDEEPGTEVVLELGVAEMAFSVTLLFRVVSHAPGRTVLEWWPRRQTDPKLLELWLESLDSQRRFARSDDAAPPDQQRAALVRQVMEAYRRVLSNNPFDVLGVHWTSGVRLVAEASRAMAADLQSQRGAARSDAEVLRYLDMSLERVRQATEILSTIEGRRAVRRQMVPEKELQNALKQAQFLLEIARREGRADAIASATEMLEELSV